MKHWNLNDIPWQHFDASKVDPAMIPVIKAASLVEFNGWDYARYLCAVFADDAEFCALANQWAEEEVQHGEVLRKWAELADPTFQFEKSFKRFTTGYQQLPKEVDGSVRGSRSGELIARCMVETGTSNYYTAIKDNTQEPVLKLIAAKIAADEMRHYKLFYDVLKRYQAEEKLNLFGRIKVAFSRMAESEDDELAYAYFAANAPDDAIYNHAYYNRLYAAHAYRLYERAHVDRMVAMLFKAIGLKPHSTLHKIMTAFGWAFMRRRAKKLQIEAANENVAVATPLQMAA